MTYEEIDERYHDAALDDDGEGWDDEASGGVGWDDPAETEDVDDEDLDVDEEDSDL